MKEGVWRGGSGQWDVALGVRLAQTGEGEGWGCWAPGFLEGGFQATERCGGIGSTKDDWWVSGLVEI